MRRSSQQLCSDYFDIFTFENSKTVSDNTDAYCRFMLPGKRNEKWKQNEKQGLEGFRTRNCSPIIMHIIHIRENLVHPDVFKSQKWSTIYIGLVL